MNCCPKCVDQGVHNILFYKMHIYFFTRDFACIQTSNKNSGDIITRSVMTNIFNCDFWTTTAIFVSIYIAWNGRKDVKHDDVIKCKHFPRYWPFVWGIHRSPVNSPHKGQWRGALMFSLICVWIVGWVKGGETSDLRRYPAHYDVTVMSSPAAIQFRISILVMALWFLRRTYTDKTLLGSFRNLSIS